MEDGTTTGLPGRSDALARRDEILALYTTMKRSLMKQILDLGSGEHGSSKALVAKIGELSAIHLILLKSEDAFREKFCEDDQSVPDFDALRAEIGRKLDRIRDARRSGALFEEPVATGTDGSSISL